MKYAILSASPKETQQIASCFIKSLLLSKPLKKGALVVSLEGNLGAGKTEFLKGVAHGAHCHEKIASPTFVLMKRFPLKSKNFSYLWHLDCYRLEHPQDLDILGFSDLLADPRNIIFIEWGNKIKSRLPKKHWTIKFKITGARTRILEFSF